MERTHTIGMLNLRTGDWHHKAFAAVGIDWLYWPQITTEREPIGSVERHGKTLTCYPVIGDQQAALRGIKLQPHELSINASTGSQVSQITAEFRPGDCQTRPWFDGQFMNTITHIPAGRSLMALEALLTELPRMAGLKIDNSWGLIQRAADAATGDGLVCDLSFFASAMGYDGRIVGRTTSIEWISDSSSSTRRGSLPRPAFMQSCPSDFQST